jgi:hypothetical protein
MYLTDIDASNRADFIILISATDADTGDAIDFSIASDITIEVNDSTGCQKMLASVANGKVTLPSSTVLQCKFSRSEMVNLCPASYVIGGTYTAAGETDQLFTGSINVYDGVVAP